MSNKQTKLLAKPNRYAQRRSSESRWLAEQKAYAHLAFSLISYPWPEPFETHQAVEMDSNILLRHGQQAYAHMIGVILPDLEDDPWTAICSKHCVIVGENCITSRSQLSPHFCPLACRKLLVHMLLVHQPTTDRIPSLTHISRRLLSHTEI